ncbi:MAG: PcfB family protein [Christensenellaceae bacterium]|nr:PcfB family protein [Christensenellaceae bacterium]
MQEEVEQKIVSLAVDCGKLTEQTLRKAIAKLLALIKAGHQQHQYNKANPHGKMTVRQLAAKDKGLQSIEVTDENIGSFNRIARKYGIDFAPFKVKGENRYMVFFKAPDADAMTAAFKEYTAKQVKKVNRPSILEKLQHFKALIQSAVVDRTKRKELER